jgi:creatinine amidohydrolase
VNKFVDSVRKASAGAALALVVALCCGHFGTARAQQPTSVFLEDLTWTELRDAIARGKTTVIVPIGGTEQNGPGMALGKHNVRVKLLSGKIALALANALVAPVIAYVPEGAIDPPTEHMRFPGTITIPASAFEQTLEFAARSFRHHGFKDVVFLGDHGGYQDNDRAAANKLNREWAATNVRAHAIDEYYAVTQREYVQALKAAGLTPGEIGSHAGAADVSLMLALDPGLVRADKLAALPKPGPADGVYGDPSKSSAALGAIGVDLIVTHSVAAIKAATARP